MPAGYEPPQDFDLDNGVNSLDALPPLDLAAGIKDFLDEIGLVAKESNDEYGQADQQEEVEDVKTSWDTTVISLKDLELLALALPQDCQLSLPIDRTSYAASQDNPQQYKARLLDTVARLAIHPALTLPIAQTFSRIIVDIAARWLLLAGFDGRTFPQDLAETDDAAKLQLVAVLAAFARLLKRFPHIYP